MVVIKIYFKNLKIYFQLKYLYYLFFFLSRFWILFTILKDIRYTIFLFNWKSFHGNYSNPRYYTISIVILLLIYNCSLCKIFSYKYYFPIYRLYYAILIILLIYDIFLYCLYNKFNNCNYIHCLLFYYDITYIWLCNHDYIKIKTF